MAVKEIIYYIKFFVYINKYDKQILFEGSKGNTYVEVQNYV